MEATTDERLAEQAAAGTLPAFEALVQRHHARFYRLAYRIVLNREDAEELVQDAFLKLWSGKARFNTAKGAQFTTWFTRIIVNQCRDSLRKKNRRKQTGLEGVELSQEAVQETLLQQMEEGDALLHALRALPERQRSALVLWACSDLPQEALADSMGVSRKAFESLLSRGKMALRQQWESAA